MDNGKFQEENPLLYWLFIAFGALMVVISFVLRARNIETIWVDVLLNIGASLIATAGIAFLYQRFGTNSLKYYTEQLLHNFHITQRTLELGMQDLWRERRHIPNDMWNSFTASAISDVWLMGIAELGFCEDPTFHKIVSDGAERGCNFKFLLLDPDSIYANEVDEKEGGVGLVRGRIRRALQGFVAMQNANKSKKGKVEIRVYSNVPQVSIVRSDDNFLITPYMFYRTGNSSFTFRLRRLSDGISDHYTEYFEKSWEKARPVLNNGKE